MSPASPGDDGLIDSDMSESERDKTSSGDLATHTPPEGAPAVSNGDGPEVADPALAGAPDGETERPRRRWRRRRTRRPRRGPSR